MRFEKRMRIIIKTLMMPRVNYMKKNNIKAIYVSTINFKSTPKFELKT